jgi:rhodanese-related sulfurtransferase
VSVAVARLIAIVGLSVVVSTGSALVRRLPWVPDPGAAEAGERQHDQLRVTAGVTLDEFLALVDEGAVVVDARPASAFDERHLAAPQTFVINVPAAEFDAHLPQLREFEGCRFVLYCSSDACDSSAEVYAAMVNVGFDPADLFIYFPGWEGIVEAGLETVE